MQRWGDPRLTRDVDVALLTGFGNEEPFIDALIELYVPRVKDLRAFALRTRVMLLQSAEGIPIDISLAGLPFEERLMDRASEFEFLEGCRLSTCSAEDLIVLKAFADRPRDWGDIVAIVQRQPCLDQAYIEAQLTPLIEVKQALHILVHLREVLAKQRTPR